MDGDNLDSSLVTELQGKEEEKNGPHDGTHYRDQAQNVCVLEVVCPSYPSTLSLCVFEQS